MIKRYFLKFSHSLIIYNKKYFIKPYLVKKIFYLIIYIKNLKVVI